MSETRSPEMKLFFPKKEFSLSKANAFTSRQKNRTFFLE